MFLSLKRYFLHLLLLVLAAPSLFGFSLLGPVPSGNADAFETAALGYNLQGAANGVNFVDLGTPKDFGQDYRWNCGNIYYAYDSSFLEYFGASGVAAVDAAFEVFNALNPVSNYSPDLHEFPLQTTRRNFTAFEAGLFDVKSTVMSLLLEQLGLAPPERYVWGLHQRYLPPGAICPNYQYVVIQRNFDPATLLYSSFVNGSLYGYRVYELCSYTIDPLPGVNALAQTYPYDPDSDSVFNSVASGAGSSTVGTTSLGAYYNGLTRDDFAGLQYLLSKNRVHLEAVETSSLLMTTNTSSEQLLTTLDYSLFIAQALTNPPAVLQGLYPGLSILTSSNYFGLQVITNYLISTTNLPYTPVGSAPSTVITPFYTTNPIEMYAYTFGNVVVNPTVAQPGGAGPYTNGFISLVSSNLVAIPYLAVANTNTSTNISVTIETNITTKFVQNYINGEFYIMPTNSCGPHVLLGPPLLTTITATTNTLFETIVAPTATGILATAVSIVTYVTNHDYVYYPIQCVAAPNELLAGIEKLNFFRQDYDSLLGKSWKPVTNYYRLTAVTNGVSSVQTFQRIITQPDIVFYSQDLITAGGNGYSAPAYVRTTPNFNATLAAASGLAGPGTIDPPAAGGVPISVIFNRGVPAYLNANPADDGSGVLLFQWGSFDGTTNPPVVYPNTASLQGIENSLFLQITTSGSLTNGNVGVPYNAVIQALGQASPPYVWSVQSNSGGLPPGLSFAGSASLGSAVISGNPTTPGIYDFIIQVADNTGRVTQRNFVIYIYP